MEYIVSINVPKEGPITKAAQAVRWMHGVPVPDGVLGPLGSGRARHLIFKNSEAPLAFTGVQTLERFFNKVLLVPL
jgi:hypothetical protein